MKVDQRAAARLGPLLEECSAGGGVARWAVASDSGAGGAAAPAAACLGVVGLRCSDCAARVRARLLATPGVIEADVRLSSALAIIRYDPRVTGLSTLIETIARASSGRGHRFLAVPVKTRFAAR